MWIRSTLVALLLSTSLAHAQAISPLGGSTNNAGSSPPALATPAPAVDSPSAAPAARTARTPAAAARGHKTMAERFSAANTSHDGKLTLEQARAGHLRAVVRDFSMIDKSKKGYVTMDEIKAHQSEQRAARKAAKDAKK